MSGADTHWQADASDHLELQWGPSFLRAQTNCRLRFRRGFGVVARRNVRFVPPVLLAFFGAARNCVLLSAITIVVRGAGA